MNLKIAIYAIILFVLGYFFLPSISFAATEITEDITTDTTWGSDESVYIIRNSVNVSPEATVTVLPGTTIKLDSSGELIISGSLQSVGTLENRITFTSIADDTVGGEDNDDEDEEIEPTASDYFGITILEGGLAEFEFVSIKHAFVSLSIDQGSTVSFNTSEITNSTIPLFADITADFEHTGNIFANNEDNYIYLAGDSFGRDVFLEFETAPYKLLNALNINTGHTLTIGPGVHMKGGSIQLIGGSLTVNGTSPARVDFENTVIQAFNGATGTIHFADFHSANTTVIQAWDNSTLSMNGVVIDNPGHDGVYVFDNTQAAIRDSIVRNSGEDRAALVVFQGSELTLENTILENAEDCMIVFDGVDITANKLILKNCSGAGLVAFGNDPNYADNQIHLTRSEITGNGIGVLILEETVISVLRSSIHGNTIGVESVLETEQDFSKNWWGSSIGPLHDDLNPDGMGNKAIGALLFDPWLVSNPLSGRDPIILIPGITGSYLFKDYGDEEEVWPNANKLILPGADHFLDDLALNTDGTKNLSKPMRVGDIIRSVTPLNADRLTSHIFDGLIAVLEEEGYEEGSDLFVFPYDWRMKNADTAILLKEKIEHILEETGKEKVNIIAHSMGGLIAKKYIADTGAEQIDNLVFIGTPHLGAPKVFKSLLYGDDMGMKKLGLGLNDLRLKAISQNMPAVYGLLPGKRYVEENGNWYIEDLINTNSYLDYEKTKDFMISRGSNAGLFAQAEELHESIDNLNMSDINVHNFTGCGETKTIGAITVRKKKSILGSKTSFKEDYFLRYADGDETVPLASSYLASGNQYFIKGTTHGGLPSAPGLPETILALFSDELVPSYDHISQTLEGFCAFSGKGLSTHSPIVLHVYDEFGNHTGPNEDGDIEYLIPGVTYDAIEGVTFLFLPDGKQYTVNGQATDTGAYDLYIDTINNDNEKVESLYFSEIALDSVDATAEIHIPAGVVVSMQVEMDQNGDGVFEETVEPTSILTEIEANDVVAPETESELSGKIVSFSPEDDNSGVLKTEYSLDGENWHMYTSAFNAEGKTVQYFSTDNAGNIEEVKSILVTADVVPQISSTGIFQLGVQPESAFVENKKTLPEEINIESSYPRDEQTMSVSIFDSFRNRFADSQGSIVKQEEQGEHQNVDVESLSAQSVSTGFKASPAAVVGSVAGISLLAFVVKRFIIK